MPERRRPLAAALLVATLAGGLAFGGAIGNSFLNWDDDLYITENPRIRSLSRENLAWMATSTTPLYWQPVAWLAHALDHAAGGLDPSWHHATSVALHALNLGWVLLLLGALLRAARRERGGDSSNLVFAALAATLLYGLHPLRVEPVAWAAEKKELLCAFFALPAALAYLRYVGAATTRARGAWYAAALALHCLALASKPMAVTLPLVLLLLDLYPLERLAGGARRALLEKLPFLAASLAVGWLTVVAQQRAGALAVEKLALLDRSLLAVRGAVFYLEQTLWPSGLVPFYPLPRARLIAPSLLCAAVLLGLVLIAGWRWRRGERWWLISLAAYVVLLLPVSGLLQAGSQAAADRFSYLPSLALFPLVGAALLRLFELSAGWSRGARWALRLAPLALAALLALRSTEQLAIWRDSESFWTHVARSFPGQVSQAHNNLGVVYHRRGELARAASEYRRALLIFPDNPDAHNNLGLVLAIVGDYPEAERELELAIRLRPRHAEAHLNLAKLYLATGRRQAALRFLARAAELGAPPEQVAALARTIAGARRR